MLGFAGCFEARGQYAIHLYGLRRRRLINARICSRSPVPILKLGDNNKDIRDWICFDCTTQFNA